jgi:hypothetical protein
MDKLTAALIYLRTLYTYSTDKSTMFKMRHNIISCIQWTEHNTASECTILVILIYCINYEYFTFLLLIPQPTITYICMCGQARMYVNMKIANVWDVLLCGMAEMYQYCTIKNCLHLEGRR